MDQGRRQLLMFAGLLGLGAAWQVFGVRQPRLEFRAIRGFPGYEFAQMGGVSGLAGTDVLTIGLEDRPEPLAPEVIDSALHHGGDGVPVAVFSDFFCPYCRGLIGRLAARDGPEIAVTWHELPPLGANSVIAARAAEAAALQGGYVAFYEALIAQGFRPTPSWMAGVADEVGLSGSQLRRDMDGPVVADRLTTSARSAASLGIRGTPGIVIGRKAVLGALDEGQMERLIGELA